MAKKITNPSELDAIRDRARAEMDLRSGLKEMQVTVHMGTCGIAAGARDVLSQLVASQAFVSHVTIRQSGCAGLCDQEPMLTVADKSGNKVVYGKLDRNKVREIIREHVMAGRPVAKYFVNA
jgi:(2Fe-2S) ferredoxin